MDSNAKLIALHDKLMRELRILQQGISDVEKQEGPKGEKGDQGPKGEQGDRGRDGVDGSDGRDGADGKKGLDGEAGVSITNVTVDFDNHLRVDLSDGNTIDAGAIDVNDLAQGGVTAVYSGGGNNASGDSALFIQDTQPNHSGPYLWVQTNYCGDDCCMTFWVEDGK